MNKQRISKMEKDLAYNINDVWSVITDNDDCTWRRDIERIEKVSEHEFIEHGKNHQTAFNIITFEKPTLYEFEMKSNVFTGRWTGELTEQSSEKTKMVFTETINFTNVFVKYVSYLMLNLRKIQKEYFEDLEKRLEL